jgi:hypothetical protein
VCIDYQDYAPGVPSLTNMERAVAASRHTLLVLTPAWVASQWTELESSLGYALRTQHTLPILREPCNLPPRFKILTYVDLTTSAELPREFGKLVDAIRGVSPLGGGDSAPTVSIGATPPPPASTSGNATLVGKGLEALVDLMQRAEVQAKVAEYRASFETAYGQISILSDYKQLHDLLHTLQFRCYEPLAAQMRLPDDGTLFISVSPYVSLVPDTVEQLKEVVARGRVAEQENVWIRTLDQTGQLFEQAADTENADQLKVVARRLGDILGQCPARINTRLNAAAGALRVTTLIKTFDWLRNYLVQHGVDPAKVQLVADVVPMLNNLDSELGAVTAAHDRWQLLEEGLRRVEAALAAGTDTLELEWSFPVLKEQAEVLYANNTERWAVTLSESAVKLEAALGSQNPAQMRSAFASFRTVAGLRFHRVDKELKALCEELREQVGDRLESLLREL